MEENNTQILEQAVAIAGVSPTDENYPINFEADYPEKSSRGLALLTLLFFIPKAIILLPHFVIIWALGVVSFFAFVIGQFAVLFTGKYPRSFFDFLVGFQRWQSRVSAYFSGLTDKYPPFRLGR